MLAVGWIACTTPPDPPPAPGPLRAVTTRYAALRYPASWSVELDVEGRAAFGVGRCAVEVVRTTEPPEAAATGSVHARLPDAAFGLDIPTEATTWAGAPAIRAAVDVRTEPWPAGEPLHLEAIATADTVVATSCADGGYAALRPELARFEAGFVPRDGPVPPVSTRHLRMPVVPGWTVTVAGGDREELFAWAPICSVVARWTPRSADEALAEEIARSPNAGPRTTTDAVLFGLPARRSVAVGGDGTVTYRSDVTTAPLDGGTVVLTTSATEYEPCGDRIAALVPLVGLATDAPR
ncbi:MAG: hypothetical protein ABMB14_28205 [Myxococcota bacterium]